MTKQRVANMFAYTSLVCSLSVWLALGLYLLQSSLDATLPGSQWLLRQAGEFWLLVEAVGLVLAIVATALRSRLRWITLAAPILMALFLIYARGT